MTTPFLGRTVFNTNNLTYSFRDGSGVIPVEAKYEANLAINLQNITGVSALTDILKISDRYKTKDQK